MPPDERLFIIIIAELLVVVIGGGVDVLQVETARRQEETFESAVFNIY